jgi:glycosyltransferase involved in cell wall biosynthesis
MNEQITAIVYTLNEERRLPLIYQNIRNFCKIVVFDGGSTDGTLEYCKKNEIEVILRPAVPGNTSNVALKEDVFFCMNHVQTKYVLNVICSHYYPPNLLNAFLEAASNNYDAVYHDVVMWRYGRIVHRPFFRRQSTARIFHKKTAVNFADAKIHDELGISFNSKTMLRLKAIDKYALHIFQDEDFKSTTAKHLKYAAIEAQDEYLSGKKIGYFSILFRPVYRFLYHYLRSGAILNGVPGLVYSISILELEFAKSIMHWELANQGIRKEAINKNNFVRLRFLEKFNSEGPK